MISERPEVRWQRPRGVRAIHVVAVLSALLAAGSVLGLFNQFGPSEGEATSERQLIASVDLRIANPAELFAKGETQARTDVEAGTLKLQQVGPRSKWTAAELARNQRLKQRYGITWVLADKVTPQASAFAAGYNHIAQAEIERRHGPDFVEQLLRGEEPDTPKQDKAGTP